MGQGSLRELAKAHGYVELENGLRMPKESKWAKNAQGERNRTNGSRKVQSSMSIKSMTKLSHWEKNKQQTQRGLTGTSRITPRQEQQNGMAESGNRIMEKAKNELKKGKPRPSP